MSQYVEFDYETVDDRILTVEGQTNGNEIYFKVFEQNSDKKVRKNTLTQVDISNIEKFIEENCETEIDYVSDFYERSCD